MDNLAKQRLILKISQLYYLENKNQEEIAKIVNISRPQVSRLLTSARQNGVVSIKINSSFSESSKYEKELIDKFGLDDAILIDSSTVDEEKFAERLAEEVEVVFNRYINDKNVVAMSAGKMLTLLSEHVRPIDKKDIVIMPAGGGLSIKTSLWQSNSIISNFANKWECVCLPLNVPSFVSHPETKEALLKEKDIQDAFNKAKKADVLITGLGHIDDYMGSLNEGGSVSDEDFKEMKSKGVVLTLCGSYIDIDGNEIDCTCRSKSLNLELNEFSNKTKVIAIAYGNRKIQPIIAGLKTKRLNVLVTDLDTAKKVLEY